MFFSALGNEFSYPAVSTSPELIEFSRLFCKELLTKEYEKYCESILVEQGMKQAVQNSVKFLTEESIDKALGQEIISKCFKLDVDFAKIQSFLHGQEFTKWKKRIENHEDDPDKYEQLKLTENKFTGGSDNGDVWNPPQLPHQEKV